MMETLKQKVKNSLKEMEEKTNKKMGEINKSLRKTQENQGKNKQEVNQTVEVLKTEIEAIKKMETRGILDMESLGK